MSDKPIPESEPIERWTPHLKAVIILEVLKGQISVPEAARKYGFTQGEYRKWADESSGRRRSAEDEAQRPRSETSSRDQAIASKDRSARDGRRNSSGGDATFFFGRSNVERVVAKGKGPRQRVCRLLKVACSASYYQNRERTVIVDEVLAQQIKHMIDAEPYLGYRMVWARLRMQNFAVNRKAVWRIMQIKGWQCHRRLKKRCSPRVQSSVSIVAISNVRWATDATYIWTRWDGLIYLNAILDCADRECIGFNVSQRNDAIEAAWALEDALINRFGALPTADTGVMLRTDNALVYASELYRKLAKSYGLHQEFIRPHAPEQNGVAESFMVRSSSSVYGNIVSKRTPKRKPSSPGGSATTTRPGHIHASATSRQPLGENSRASK